MKNPFLCVVLLFLMLSFCHLDAQINQGRWMVGGTFATGTTSLESGTSFFQLNPRAGYFLTDQFALTGNFGLFLAGGGFEENFSGGIGGRYYFGTEASLLPFANLGVTFGDNLTQLGGGLGANLFITPNVALEGSLALARIFRSSPNDLTTVNMVFGFQVFLN